MPAAGRRRIIRWTVIAVVAPVLLLTSYVSAWLVLPKAAMKGIIPWTIADAVEPVFVPIDLYCNSDLPGAKNLNALWFQINGIDPQMFDGHGP
jgi:hypothetical protein